MTACNTYADAIRDTTAPPFCFFSSLFFLASNECLRLLMNRRSRAKGSKRFLSRFCLAADMPKRELYSTFQIDEHRSSRPAGVKWSIKYFFWSQSLIFLKICIKGRAEILGFRPGAMLPSNCRVFGALALDEL